MKFEIKNKFNNEVQFTCKLSAYEERLSLRLQLGVAVKKAISQKVDLAGADLSGVNLCQANLCGANLYGAYLVGAELDRVNLSWANLSRTNLSKADLYRANLSETNLCEADLSGANLTGADLSEAYLYEADLSEADLTGVDLYGARLSGANLSGTKLSVIKNDFWAVLLQAIPEISMLEKNILEGKIDGSTYEGECACLCGTIEKSERFKNKECDMRDVDRPIENFFLNIRPGDTPENNQVSKIVMEWLQEFKGYIGDKE